MQAPNPNLKKPSQAIYVPPPRKSSNVQNQGLKDEVHEEKDKSKIEIGTKILTPHKKKSSRIELRKTFIEIIYLLFRWVAKNVYMYCRCCYRGRN